MEMTFDEAARIVRVQSYLLNAQIEMTAMVAENMQAASFGNHMVYTHDDFMALADKYGTGFNSVQTELYPQNR